MTVLTYQSSKGPKVIAEMPLSYASNALAKLQRERVDASRDAEIEAIAAHVAKLSEEIAETRDELRAEPAEPVADEPNPRAVMGGNNPPEPTTFETIKTHMEDLLVEAHNWADGTEVTTQAQADEAGRLISDLEQAARAAEAQRVAEKKPLDDQVAEIQARYNAYIADRKNKVPGKVWKAVDALKATVKPYLDKLEAERLAKAEEARQAAQKAAEEAAESARAAQASDLGAQEAAEAKIAEARAMESAARSLETSRVQLHGGERAKGLRTTWTPVLADPGAALRHYIAQRPDDVKAVLLGWAKSDVANGARKLPGFDIIEGTTL